jgi:transposase-like protein
MLKEIDAPIAKEPAVKELPVVQSSTVETTSTPLPSSPVREKGGIKYSRAIVEESFKLREKGLSITEVGESLKSLNDGVAVSASTVLRWFLKERPDLAKGRNVCQWCGGVFENQRANTTHESDCKDSPNRILSHICTYEGCEEKFGSEKEVREHFEQKHREHIVIGKVKIARGRNGYSEGVRNLVLKLINERKTSEEISRDLGISTQTVDKWAKDFEERNLLKEGIKELVKTRRERRKPSLKLLCREHHINDEEKKQLINMLLLGFSQKDITKEMRLHRTTILRYTEEFIKDGLIKRTGSSAHAQSYKAGSEYKKYHSDYESRPVEKKEQTTVIEQIAPITEKQEIPSNAVAEAVAVVCKWCGSDKIIKAGLDEKQQQMFKCSECGTRFIDNGNPLRFRHPQELIDRVLFLHSQGISSREIEKALAKEGYEVSYQSISDWIKKDIGETVKKTTEEPSIICPSCGSTEVIKKGIRYNKKTGEKQRYLCNKCGRDFVLDPHDVPDPEIVAYAIRLHSEGVSYRQIKERLKNEKNHSTDHTTIMRWVNMKKPEEAKTSTPKGESDSKDGTIEIEGTPAELAEYTVNLENERTNDPAPDVTPVASMKEKALKILASGDGYEEETQALLCSICEITRITADSYEGVIGWIKDWCCQSCIGNPQAEEEPSLMWHPRKDLKGAIEKVIRGEN